MLHIRVTEPSQVTQARLAAVAAARGLGFDDAASGTVALVVTEVATNLVKHASGGQLLVDGVTETGNERIELLALDTGPGMANVTECLRDGYSTAGSPGTGLGAVARNASLMDIYSVPGTGTVLFAAIRPKGQGRKSTSQAAPVFDHGAISLAKAGESVCGDGWALHQELGRCVAMVADGLGHGLSAADAAREALHIFRDNTTLAPAEIMALLHAGLRATRGAAAAVAEIDSRRQAVRYCGVGNIAGVIFTPGGRHGMVSHSGTVGHEARKIHEFTYPWSAGALLVMHSDGLSARWDLGTYFGLARRHPRVVAGVLFRDFSRPRDDGTVVVVREAGVVAQSATNGL